MSVKMKFKTEIFINRKIINDQTDYAVRVSRKNHTLSLFIKIIKYGERNL